MLNRSNRHKISGLALSLGIGLGVFALTLFLFIGVTSVHAAVDPTDISFSIPGNSAFFMDSNKFCNDVEGPDGVWLPVTIMNNHPTDTATGLEVEFEAPISTTADDPFRYIGNLGPGESADIFFFLDYSALRTDPNCLDGTNGWYSEDYTVTLRSIDGSNSLTADAVFDTDTFDSFSMISAAAGGALASDLLGPGATVGQVITQVATYDFGNNPAGSQLFLQPSGNGATFRDDCFRLVGSEILASNVPGVSVGVVDQLFFPNTDTGNMADTIIVEYQWLILCSPGTTTQTFPWAEITSGTQFKYNESGYMAATFPLPVPVTGTVAITKTVQVPTSFVFGVDDPIVVTYSVEIANAFTMPIVLSSLSDQLDPNMAFVNETATSDIDSANSTVSPAASDTGLLDWFGVPPDNSYIVPAQSSINLVYQVAIDYDSGDLNPQIFTNTVTATVGSDVLGPVQATVTIEPAGILSVGLNSFGVAGYLNYTAWLSIGLVLLGLILTAVYLRRSKYQAD